MTDCDLETSVPDWIIDHPETFAVFQELGICNGSAERLVSGCWFKLLGGG